MATPPKITLDELIMHPHHASGLAEQQVRDTLKEIAERTAALRTLETQILWRLLAESSSGTKSDGFPRLLNAKQLAEHLAVPESWVREQARLGQLPSIKLGHYVRFRLDDVQQYLHPPPTAPHDPRIHFDKEDLWPPYADTTDKTVLAELADVAIAWTTVLWAHAVHENGLISRLRRRLKNTSPKPS
jgi:excisionase family DNA binding protein